MRNTIFLHKKSKFHYFILLWQREVQSTGEIQLFNMGRRQNWVDFEPSSLARLFPGPAIDASQENLGMWSCVFVFYSDEVCESVSRKLQWFVLMQFGQ